MKTRKFVAIFLCLIVIFDVGLRSASACGPFYDTAVMSFDDNPDLPLKKFLQGELGVIRPTFAKSYLAVAYRFLSNKPFTTNQIQAVDKLWRVRLTSDELGADSGAASGSDAWTKVRAKVLGAKPESIYTWRRLPSPSPTNSWETYLNCPEKSFASAIKLLDEKIAKHGVNSAFVKDWLLAQNQVFCHCSTPGGVMADSKAEANEPPFPQVPANENSGNSNSSNSNSGNLGSSNVSSSNAISAEIRQDRLYQHAAALFYAQRFDDAFSEFKIIASDHSSPYRKAALFMMPRCLVRKATLIALDKTNFLATLDQATLLLQGYLSDPEMSFFHSASKELLGFINFRRDPEVRLKELAAEVLSQDKAISAAAYYRSMDDYTQLLLNLQGGLDDLYSDRHKIKPIPPAAKLDELSDWITIWESENKDNFSYAYDRWLKTHSEAWLLASLHLATLVAGKSDETKVNIQNISQLESAAQLVKQTSPGFLSINFEFCSLGIARLGKAKEGNRVESLKLIKTLSPLIAVSLKKELWSAANLFMDLRVYLPFNLIQFTDNSVRRPAALAALDEYLQDQYRELSQKARKQTPKVFDYASASFLNKQMPLSSLSNFCAQLHASKMPSALQADAIQATWVRAVLVGDDALRDRMTPSLKIAYPKLAQLIQATMRGSAEDKKFACVYLILKNPGMRPYVTGGAFREEEFGKLETFGDNWWMGTGPDRDWRYNYDENKRPNKLPGVQFPELLSSGEVKAGTIELKRLLEVGSAPTFLGGAVADYVGRHRSDQRNPEALYLAVRASRYGYRDARTTAQSRRCFQLLHKNYAKSSFAAKTPYYY